MSESKDATKKRRPITAVRRSKIVKDAVVAMGVGVDDTVGTLIELLRDAAVEEVENQ